MPHLINFKQINISDFKSSSLHGSWNSNSRPNSHNSWVNTNCNKAPVEDKHLVSEQNFKKKLSSITKIL